MSVFKCKMCGGTLEINNSQTVGTCEYCGTEQTLPKLDDDKRSNLYDRANHFRRNNEFDKAMGIYEKILNEDKTDAEAYWSLVLCRYGIEYVEDPSSHKRVPTINRAQFTSVFDDDNYKSALQYADSYQRRIYEQEAKAINEIQKGILAISQKEEPFDVFICYKETDNHGRRTPDSVLANDLYHQLTQEGFKVFFARITLEDKLGSAYEPYIFAALNSSKVMVVLGTKPEFFNAVWVKNEWSRYLALIKNRANKILIPAYKDMDPYDLPEEFSHLQAQDMSKLGFMQDLIRGIKKITQIDEHKTTVVKETIVTNNISNTNPLLKRAFMFLEDGEWDSANEYCEKVLDIDPECAKAYLGKLMAELRIKKQDALKDCENPFDKNNNFKKAVRFADDNLSKTLKGYINHINERNENARLDSIYKRAKADMLSANTEKAYKNAAYQFETIKNYKDSSVLFKQCHEKAEIVRKDEIYNEAMKKLQGKNLVNQSKFTTLELAIEEFKSISGWKDADNQIEICKKKIEEIKAKAEADRLEREHQEELARQKSKKIKKIAIITTSIICVIIASIILISTVIIPNTKYNNATALMDAEKYDEAYSIFEELGNYKDSQDKLDNIIFLKTKEQLNNAKVGDSVLFGLYEQDNKTSNGKENIEWLVLEAKDGKTLVISKYALDCKKYDIFDADITWENCALRKWLNNDFINTAFSANEKAIISAVTVSADKNPEYNSNPGNTTQDQVFLLSVNEANKYFSSDSAKQCKPTDYAVANGAYVDSNNNNCQWWLRSPGGHCDHAACVKIDGDVNKYGYSVYIDDCAVRPALWIDLNAID